MDKVTIRLQYEKFTDVMHVDVATPARDIVVRAVALGPEFAGPQLAGKVLLRVGSDGTFLGITIYQFRSVKRLLRRKFLALSWRRALRLMVESMAAGSIARAHCPAV